jgi:hypothetical protein
MFKARKRNTKQNLRRKADDEDESNHTQDASKNAQEEEENGTAATIALVKKKRKLLTDLQYKKGTDAVTLLKGRDYNSNNNMVVGASVGDSATASSSQEGVMEQKHKQALEQYVEYKLVGMLGGDAAAASTTPSEPSNTTSNSNNNNLTHEELYRQLAQASESLVGRSNPETSQGGDGVAKDGDVGTGGAMLVAGTGLAEVILPVEERLKSAAATEEASIGWKGPYKSTTYYGMPQSQVPIPAGAARFQVSAADRHRHYANNTNSTDTAVAVSQSTPEHSSDQGRLGFDAARGKAATAGGNNHATNSASQTKNSNTGSTSTKASDDKVYGNFLKHHRENQWRGR